MIESLGICFDEHSVTLVHLRKGVGRTMGHTAVSLPYPAADTLDQGREAVVEKVREYLLVNRIRCEEAFVVIPEDEALFKRVRLPLTARENVKQVVEFEFENYFPLKREDVLLDYTELSGPAKETIEIHVLLAVLKRQRYEFYWDLVRKTGLTPVSMEPPISARIAMVRWLHRRKLISLPSVVLMDGAGAWQVELWSPQGRIEWRKLPKSHEQETAVQLLTSRGKTLCNGIPSDSFSALLLDEADAIREELPEPFHLVDVQECFRQAGLPAFSPQVFHATGAATRGTSAVSPCLNLLAAERRKKKKRGGVYLCFSLVVVAALLGLAVLLFPYIQAKTEVAALERQYKQLEPQIKEVEAKQKKLLQIQQDMRALTRVTRKDNLEVLRVLTPLVPEDSWLQSFELTDNTIRIRGYSKNASQLIPLLENSPHFKDVEFISPVVKRGDLENFNITMKLET